MKDPLRICILGSTGSIGTQTLEVIKEQAEHFQVVALSGNSNLELLAAQVHEYKPQYVALSCPHKARELSSRIDSSVSILSGESALEDIAALKEVDAVVVALLGFSGLKPLLKAIEAKKGIALANKESLACAGELVMRKIRQQNTKIAPVDSEHSSIFQCAHGKSLNPEEIRKIYLTASGGPFLHTSIEKLKDVTPEEAVKHPRWAMGSKISIDSATLMNKGLEVIEASYLFDIPSSKIDVVVHPQSLVHGLIEYADRTVLASLFETSMKLPIQFALSYLSKDSWIHADYPSGPALDLVAKGKLEFFAPDIEKFPALKLCYQALEEGKSYPLVLNAANEVAVQAFLQRNIGFLSIVDVIEAVLSRHSAVTLDSFETIVDVDSWARQESQEALSKLS